MLHQMGPLLEAALAFWTHVGLEEGLGARSHSSWERERQGGLRVRFFDRSGAGQLMGEPQFAQTNYACMHGLVPFFLRNQTIASQTL